jgi:hypothetical protein
MRHDHQDRVSLEIAQRIASGLAAHPEWLELARENLDRWSKLNSGSPGLLRCYAEWQSLLDRPLIDVCSALTSPTDEGQRLRQNSPFAGVLSPKEVWDIKQRLRNDQTAA